MSSKPFLVGFVVLISVIAAVSLYVSLSVDKTDKAVTSVISPDGKYKAVRVMSARGGAQPLCSDTIAIFLSVYPDRFAVSDRNYEVYAGPCAAPADRAKLPQIDWPARDAVRITVPPEAAGIAMPRKDRDASLFVRLTFVPAR